MISYSNLRSQSEIAKGSAAGAVVYLFWGSVVVYWPKLQPADAVEILSHRAIWSLITLLLLVGFYSRFENLFSILRNRRSLVLLTCASVLIAANWGLFIWASINSHVLDSSLGYFVTPLLNVILGVFFFKERLRKLQWFAIGVAAFALLVMSVALGSPPVLAFAIGITFALYGYVKKLADVEALESLTVETILLTPFAVMFLGWLTMKNQSTFLTEGLAHSLWLMSSGVVTALPLLLFGYAAIRIPLYRLGMLQYLSPTIQFLIGLFVFQENMPSERFIGFLLTWIALGVLAFDVLRQRSLK
ncbi:MAG: EamA family transporter RarD [Candidatus Nanopelagicales bacterium]